ncbi:MAG: hypothetical protein V4509_04620 [Patescibacteria group bacterium]
MKTLKQLIALFKNAVSPITVGNNRLILFATAVKALGTDASPADVAPDEVGCAETIYDILGAAFPLNVGFAFTVSTSQLYRSLLASPKYIRIDQPLEGDIVISPSGYGNGGLSNGHVGIKGELDKIMSNSSATGTFEENYTMQGWKDRYVAIGGYPMAFFRRV